MAPPKVVSIEFLLWSQALLLWSLAAYGATADPLSGDTAVPQRSRWALLLASRAILVAVFGYGLSRSIMLSAFLLLTTLGQPLLRRRVLLRRTAEFEGLWILASMVVSLAVIRHFHLSTEWMPMSVSPAQLAALCIVASTLLIVVRGGTYVVRGVLTKAGTLPSKERIRVAVPQIASAPPPEAVAALEAGEAAPVTIDIAAAAEEAEEPLPATIDDKEYNRGRLIGNLERIILTIVVAAGSYAALAFLVAAKGVVRSDEFEKSRDFTEYFLIGSLSSVLVALCAGIGLRFALVRLWPELLTLQMQ
jgi:hypothetical protein